METGLSRYLEHLPAGFQADEQLGPFLGRFLLAFERVLSGLPGAERGTSDPIGVEQLLDNIQRYFVAGPGRPDDERAPEDFLPWLAGWVAVGLREDWTVELKRQFIQKAPGLYRLRGTKACIKQMLEFSLPQQTQVEIDDSGDVPHYFSVRFRVATDAHLIARYDRIARAILDQEKPAHTYYGLTIQTPSLQIMDHPTGGRKGIIVGRTTLLGVS